MNSLHSVLFVLFTLLLMFGGRSETLIADVSGEHSGTIIFLHGLGDSGDGWFDTFRAIRKENPTIRLVCPTAPILPVTINGGMRMTSWHDLKSLNNLEKETFEGIEDTSKIS